MPPGISKVRTLSAGSAGRVKKQLNDLYLFVSYKLHQELARFGITAVFDKTGTPRPNNTPQVDQSLGLLNNLPQTSDYGRVSLITTDPNSPTAKDWEASVNLFTAADATVAGAAAYFVQGGSGVAATFNVGTNAGGTNITLPGGGTGVAYIATQKFDQAVAGQVILGANTLINATTDVAALTADGKVNVYAAGTAPSGAVVVATFTGAAAPFAAVNVAPLDFSGLVQLGMPKLNAAGQQLLLVCDSAVAGDTAWDGLTVTINAARLSDMPVGGKMVFQPYQFQIARATGIDQALSFVDNTGAPVTDIIAVDWNSLNAGVCLDPTLPAPGPVGALKTTKAVVGATHGLAMRIMAVPYAAGDWLYHAFVRQINPAVPKDYKEVADHFDGSADFIRAVTIPTLGVQKVFESVPGSFKNMRGRKCTLKAETRELNRFDSSETHYFLGVIGTPSIQFQADNESISSFEATMYRWIFLS